VFEIFKKKQKQITVWVTLHALEHGVIKTTFVDLGNGKYKWKIKEGMESIVHAEDEGNWWFRSEIEAIDDLILIKQNAIKPLEEQITKIKKIPLTPIEW
jgi:hypothetical protein